MQASASDSALSTAVYAAGFTINVGFTSRTTCLTWSRSPRSRRRRSSATTRPSPCRLRASSKPTWPFTPVSRIVACSRVVIQLSSREMIGFRQPLTRRIFRRQQRLEIDRPFNPDLWIIPHDAALMRLVPVVGGLIKKLRRLRQHDESMGKARRHPQLPVVLFRQIHAHPLTEVGRAFTDIDGDIKYLTFDHAHELPLRVV